MKKILFILTVISFAFISCDKESDDGETSENENLIVGQWRLQSSTYNGANEPLNDCNLMSTLTITSNNFQYNDRFLEFEDGPCISEVENFDYEINGENLKFIDSDGDSYTVKIQVLNNTTFTFLDDEFDDEITTSTYSRE